MNTIEAYKKEFVNYLNDKIKTGEPKNLYAPIHYILQIGGKRLRPVLTLMACDLYNGDVAQSYDAALGIEIFHNFTLVHDDIMDNAPIRRGHETVHQKWDINTGILSGDAMLIKAYRCFEKYEGIMYKKLLELFSKTALQVCEGQQFDIDFEHRDDVTIAEYLKMISFKTGVLVAAALKAGAIIAEVSTTEAQKIYEFGLYLGIAFQLQDDYLDTFGNTAIFGKQIGGDIAENKKTFLYLKALEVCDKDDSKKLLAWYNTTQNTEDKVLKVSKLFKKNNIAELTEKEIEHYTKKAFKVLEITNLHESKKTILRKFGSKLMQRSI